MRRLGFFICALMMLSACGGKTAKVSIPTTPDVEQGLASYYAEPYHGRRTASGEVFDTYQAMTAAHRTLPFNTMVRVTNENNGESVDVRINDRGPFINGRIIDLSLAAARKIEMVRAGVVPVKVKILKEVSVPTVAAAPVNGQPVYAVQVGAFENLKSAEDLKSRLDRKFSEVSIQAFAGDTTVYRVRIGSASDLESARRLASQVRKEDRLNPFVVRVN